MGIKMTTLMYGTLKKCVLFAGLLSLVNASSDRTKGRLSNGDLVMYKGKWDFQPAVHTVASRQRDTWSGVTYTIAKGELSGADLYNSKKIEGIKRKDLPKYDPETDANTESEPEELQLKQGDYVSLVKSGKLTGCIYRVAHWYHSHIHGSAPWVELCIDPKHRLVKSSNWQPALVKKMSHSVLKKLPKLTEKQEEAFLKRELTHESQLQKYGKYSEL